MKYEIRNRWTGDVQFTAEIKCDDAPTSLKVGLAVRWGYKHDADLRDAYLRDAYLRDAYLRDARHIADRVIDDGLRSDGYRFLLTRTEPGEWRVKAGCRNYTLTRARDHWGSPDYCDAGLGYEALLIIEHMRRVAEYRLWPMEEPT